MEAEGLAALAGEAVSLIPFVLLCGQGLKLSILTLHMPASRLLAQLGGMLKPVPLSTASGK